MNRTAFAFSMAAIVAVISAAPALGNQLSNGGFEFPAFAPNAGATYAPGGEPVGFAWQVTNGDVDVAHLPYSPFIEYAAYEVLQALDLNGNTIGGISQDFSTVPGQKYALSFAYADNAFEGGISSAAIKVIDVTSTTGLLTDSVSHSTSTNAPPNADWLPYSNTFQAIGTSTRLSFISTSANTNPSGGIFLDDVQVNPVPEPATWALLAIAAGCASFTFRRRT